MAVTISSFTDENNEKQYRVVFPKGDTLILEVVLDYKANPYIYKSGEVVEFGVKERFDDPECIIKKTLTIPPEGNPVLRLESEDTKLLPVNRRGYPFNIQLTRNDGVVETPIKGRLFTTQEVF